MKVSCLDNCRIFTGDAIIDGYRLVINDEKIADIPPADAPIPANATLVNLNGALVAPGLIDIQVNGGGGCLFNESPTVETIRQIGAAHSRFGTTGFLPTLISDELDIVEQAIAAVDAAISEDTPGVLGIHLEGPFLNIDRKGVHDDRKFRQLEHKHIDLLSSLENGKTILTLAPENAAPDLIAELTARGVIVFVGHSNASYLETRKAIDSGAIGFTHLFNAMSQMTGREPGVVGAALEDQKSWCGIIVDGRHVSPVTLRVAMKSKPIEKFVLVTDAMPTVGSDEATFLLQNRKVKVENGVCVSQDGTLAGSNLDMAKAVRNTMELLGLDLPSALSLASCNPAQLLGMDEMIGRVSPGFRADLVSFNDQMEVTSTWIGGRCVAADTAISSINENYYWPDKLGARHVTSGSK